MNIAVDSIASPAAHVNGSRQAKQVTASGIAVARVVRTLLCALLLAVAMPVPAQTASARFIPTFLVYYGGGPALVAADAPKLAKYDLIDIDRFRYQDIGPNTWAAIKSLNPNVQIYLYEMGPEVYSNQDSMPQVSLNTLGRYNVSRGHPMGGLNSNNPGLFQLDSASRRIYSVPYSNPGAGVYSYLMDFGSSAYQSYWLTAVKADITDQPWVADGVFVDNCLSLPSDGSYSATSAWYPTNSAWSGAMNAFVTSISAGMHDDGQKLWCNKGGTRQPDGSAVWLALDASATPPDVLLEEGAFAVKWGFPTQFLAEDAWKRQVDVLAAVKNTKAAYLSHTLLLPGQTGTDNWGRPVTYWQSLWYALGSFLLGKNDVQGNSYFMFHGGDSDYNALVWYDEYDKIDLGRALGSYAVTSIGGVNIYSREFERGYVYVNPTPSDALSVTLPQAVRQLTRDNLNAVLDSLPIINAIALNGHHAAILLKTDSAPAPDTTAPSVPGGLVGTAISASQINLSWNPSTDNVGVAGYYVYLNDAPLVTTAATSFAHTGLAAGTTYSYRISAYDAATNHSAWSATPVLVTTPTSDATAPTVPTGLSATAVSPTRINLSWNASTDNVGVTGYYVYLNNVALATTTTTSFSHTGLAAGTTYNYRVSAFDAIPNHSAWTATPVSVTTPVADTVAPSTPTGLSASGASTSQINLSWTAATDNIGVTGYRVYRGGILLATLGIVTSYQDTGLAASTSYSYTVQAIDAAGNASVQSAPASATTQAAPDTTPPTVSISSPASGTTVSGTITVTASASDNIGVAGIQFQYSGINLGAEDTTAPYSVAADTTTVANGTYTLTAVARDAAGNLATSAPVTVTVSNGSPPDTAAPSVPTGLVGTAVSASRINLSWNPSTDNVGVTGYYIYLNDVPLTMTTSTSYSHTGLTANTTYKYRVSAHDAVPNHSAWTAQVAVKTRKR